MVEKGGWGCLVIVVVPMPGGLPYRFKKACPGCGRGFTHPGGYAKALPSLPAHCGWEKAEPGGKTAVAVGLCAPRLTCLLPPTVAPVVLAL